MLEQLHILKRREDIHEAKQEAEKEFNKFFAEFHPYITGSTHHILRERFADYDHVGYLIRISVEANPQKLTEIKQWTEEHIHSDGTN